MAEAGTPGSLVLRRLADGDIAAAQAITASFGWPHRREDWQFLLRLGGGIAAEWEGEVVGTAMACPFGERLSSLGMVTVAAAHQRRGLGRMLMERLLPGLEGRTVALFATRAGVPLYRDLGFAETEIVLQCEGTAFRHGPVVLPPGERLRPMVRSDIEPLVALDAAAIGAPRRALMTALMQEARGVVLDRGGQALGFAMMRRFGRGHVIGPVIAPDARMAQALIGHWLGVQQGLYLRLDVPAESGLGGWLQEAGFRLVGDTQGMMRGALAPGPRAVRRFALVSQALG